MSGYCPDCGNTMCLCPPDTCGWCYGPFSVPNPACPQPMSHPPAKPECPVCHPIAPFPYAMPLWNAAPQDADLLAFLTRATCPAPCVGERQPEGMDWHKNCEARAAAAFALLREWD